MIAPEAPPAAAPTARGRQGAARDRAIAACAGALLAALLLAAAARQHGELPFGAAVHAGWWGCLGLAALVALAVRGCRRDDVGRALGALFAALAIAVGGLGFCGAAGGAVWEAVFAAGLGLVAGAVGGRAPVATCAGAFAVAASAPALGVAWAGDAIAGGTCALLCGLGFAIARRPAALAAARARGARWLRQAATAGAFVLAGQVLQRAGDGAWCAIAAAFAVTALAAAASEAPWLALACSALAAASSQWVAAPVRSGFTLVAAHGDAQVLYGRATQELRLCIGARLVDAVGPDRCEAPLASALAHACTRAGDRILVFGAGRAAASLAEIGERVVDVVDAEPEAAPLRTLLLRAGPVGSNDATAPVPRARTGSGPHALAALAAGARQAVVLAEPLADGAPATRADVQRELARVAGDGVLLQVVALDRSPARALHELFAAACAVHAWNGLFLVGDAAVLASAPRPFDAQAVPPFAAWSASARWLAHEAHLGDAADVQRALLGTLRAPATPPEIGAGASGRAEALAVVAAWVVPAPAVDCASPSVLRRWSALQAELRAAAARVRALADDADGRGEAQTIASRFLHVGAPRAELQAALGLPTPDGVTLRAPVLASRCAVAIDPTFFANTPAVCASLPVPRSLVSALEDFADLPPAPRLAALASGDEPLAVALRARFPSRCARALVAELAAAPLAPAPSQALRELADAFVLREAEAVLAPHDRVRELFAYWRGDLPIPAALAALARGGPDDRRMLAKALRSRREPSCRSALADLLEAPELEVRQLAAEGLRSQLADRIPYDPDGPQSARHEAAERLRSLHNRAP